MAQERRERILAQSIQQARSQKHIRNIWGHVLVCSCSLQYRCRCWGLVLAARPEAPGQDRGAQPVEDDVGHVCSTMPVLPLPLELHDGRRWLAQELPPPRASGSGRAGCANWLLMARRLSLCTVEVAGRGRTRSSRAINSSNTFSSLKVRLCLRENRKREREKTAALS